MNENFDKWKSFLDYSGHLGKNFGIYSRLYTMTTENIAGILNGIDLEPKSVLTVASSGDQVLESVLHGAKRITCFDINPFTFYQVKLKLAAIRTLSYEEFLDFFYVKNKYDGDNTFYNESSFEKIYPNLDKDSYTFFSYILDTYNNDTKEIQKDIYYNFSYNLNHMKTMCNYLEEDNYYKVKRDIHNTKVDYIETDFINLNNKLDKKYDLILLSNISDSINKMYKKNSLKQFHADVMKLTENLNYEGIMQLAYIYVYLSYPMRPNDFYYNDKREKVFPKDLFDIMKINAYDDKCMDSNYKDKVITYQKKKG